MPGKNQRADDADDAEDANHGTDEAMFQRIAKQRDKATTLKDDRRQQGKEFGRSVFKYHKERRKTNDKP